MRLLKATIAPMVMLIAFTSAADTSNAALVALKEVMPSCAVSECSQHALYPLLKKIIVGVYGRVHPEVHLFSHQHDMHLHKRRS